MCCFHSELRVSFNDNYFEIGENFEEDHVLFVMIENLQSVVIPPDVYISISAVVQNTTSNATIGINILTNKHSKPLFVFLFN